jgi:hypothetical protein
MLGVRYSASNPTPRPREAQAMENRFRSSAICAAMFIDATTLRSWRNRIGLQTDAGGNAGARYTFADAMRIASVNRLQRDLGVGVSEAVTIVNRHFEAFRIGAAAYLERRPKQCPVVLSYGLDQQPADRVFGSYGAFAQFVIARLDSPGPDDTGDFSVFPTPPRAALILDLGEIAREASIAMSRPAVTQINDGPDDA